jgi:hypothetical protein
LTDLPSNPSHPFIPFLQMVGEVSCRQHFRNFDSQAALTLCLT